jgi:hypothetical protein
MFEWNKKDNDATLTLDKAIATLEDVKSRSNEVDFSLGEINARNVNGNLELHAVGEKFDLTSHAFEQFCAKIGAPADYLRELPVDMAARCLNYGLDEHGNKDCRMLVTNRNNAGPIVRALTSRRFSRVWDADVLTQTQRLVRAGWEPSHVRYNDSGLEVRLRGNVQENESSGLSGLAVSARVVNSEVGGIALSIEEYVERLVCSNGMMVKLFSGKQKHRHIGNLHERFKDSFTRLESGDAEAGLGMFKRTLEAAQSIMLGDTKEEVIDTIYKDRIPDLSKRVTGEAFDIAATSREDGDPRSIYGMVQGITRLSQGTWGSDRNRSNAHNGRWQERLRLDNAAAKLLARVSLN